MSKNDFNNPFLKKKHQKKFWGLMFLKGMILSLASNLPSTFKITWENTKLVLFSHLYGICI